MNLDCIQIQRYREGNKIANGAYLQARLCLQDKG